MKKCEVCDSCDSKYRCPKCRILYCSVACYKSHRGDCVKFVEENNNDSKNGEIATISDDIEPGEITDSDLQDEDKLNDQQLSALENCQDVKDLLQNEHLRKLIQNIDENDCSRETELEKAMTIPIFTQFADRCLEIVGKTDKEME